MGSHVHLFDVAMHFAAQEEDTKRRFFFVPASDIFIDCARKFDLMRFIDAAKARWLPKFVFVCNGRDRFRRGAE